MITRPQVRNRKIVRTVSDEQLRKEAAEFYAMMEERKAPKGRFQHFKYDADLQRHLKYVKEAVDSGDAKF